MTDPQEVPFDDLQLVGGQALSIIPDLSNSTAHDAVYIGVVPENAIILTAPESGEFPVVEEGQEVAIRVMSVNGLASFKSVVLFITDTPLFMVFLDFPQSIRYRSVRGSTRVDIALPVLASTNTQPKKTSAGKIVDISGTGARIILSDIIADVGDKITVKGKFSVANIKRVLEIDAVVRVRKPAGEEFSYGVEFFEGDEDKRLVLFGFIFHAMSFGRIQKLR